MSGQSLLSQQHLEYAIDTFETILENPREGYTVDIQGSNEMPQTFETIVENPGKGDTMDIQGVMRWKKKIIW